MGTQSTRSSHLLHTDRFSVPLGQLAVALVLAVLLVAVRSRGGIVRTLALAMMVLALANPSFTREDREPLSSVVVVVVDKSPSQSFGDRTAQTETARAALVERLTTLAPAAALRTARGVLS